MKTTQIIRLVAFVLLIAGLVLLPGSSGLTNQPFDMVSLLLAIILLVTGLAGLKTTEIKVAENVQATSIVKLVSLLVIVFAALTLLGNIYNARAYLYIIFVLPGDMAGIWNNLVEFSFVFAPMVTSLFTLLSAAYLRKTDPVIFYDLTEQVNTDERETTGSSAVYAD